MAAGFREGFVEADGLRIRYMEGGRAGTRKGGNVCNRRILLVVVRSGEGPLTEHITATQAQPPERVFMPHSRPSKKLTGLGGGPIYAKKIGVCRREGQLAKLPGTGVHNLGVEP